jgi:hypothetical protein
MRNCRHPPASTDCSLVVSSLQVHPVAHVGRLLDPTVHTRSVVPLKYTYPTRYGTARRIADTRALSDVAEFTHWRAMRIKRCSAQLSSARLGSARGRRAEERTYIVECDSERRVLAETRRLIVDYELRLSAHALVAKL